MMVMQYAGGGNLLSYLNQNINKLTWYMKLQLLSDIAHTLSVLHNKQLIHCDLHGENIVLISKSTPLICDLGLSRSTISEASSDLWGVLPFIAPEVFSSHKFTKASDIYAFGIIMYLVATGEPPFRERPFDKDLVCDILSGSRPTMTDSAPDEYKKFAEKCCDADPNKRPRGIVYEIENLIDVALRDESDDSIWNSIYCNNVKPLSRVEK
jgi:serine/threonine protein kinase